MGQSDDHELITKGVGGGWVGWWNYHVIQNLPAAGDFFRLYAYKTRFSFAKTMVLERFRNVVQAILNTEITKISGLRPDSSQNPFSIASIIN